MGFEGQTSYLMPMDDAHGVVPGAKVKPLTRTEQLPLGLELLGRVIDARGHPLDAKGPILTDNQNAYRSLPINPLNRRPVKVPLDVGVNAINACITVGQGSAWVLFAGSGVGKSVLLGMMTKGTNADVIVVGLIGERGREVKEFIDEILGEEGLEKGGGRGCPCGSVTAVAFTRVRNCVKSSRVFS